MIGIRHVLLFCAALCVVGFACVATANMIQTRPTGETVFDNSGAPWPFFNQVAAINYDNGGQGIGYNVPAPGAGCTAGASYRPDAVNFKTSTAGAPAIPFQIGCSQGPNSFNYTVNISQSGPYQITLQLADNSAGGSWNILIDGVVVTSVSTPNTGSFDTFAASTSGPFSTSLGNHKLTLAWGAGDANFAGDGDILTWQGGVAPATAINSVAMSCGNSCGFVGGTAGTVGTAQATMSTGSFAGSWSLRTSATDNFGTTCKNYGGGFAINSSTGAVSNGAIANGTYDGICLVATQGGAGGSPFAQAVTFTGSGSGTTIPPAAQNAGFTTVAADYDFTQPQFAVQSNWLDCGTGTTGGGSGGNNPAFAWHRIHSNNGTLYDCNVQQANDPTTGTPVLDMQWLTSYNSINPNGQMFVVISGRTDNKTSFLDFGMAYYQVTARQEGNFSNGGPNAFWSWTSDCDTNCSHGPLEPDYFEFFGNGGFQFGSAGIIDHINGGAFDQRWWQSNTSNNVNVPAGYTINQYHTYGTLLTSNGSSAIYACGFIDDVLQKCVTASTNVLQMADRYYLILWVGGSPPVGGNEHLYVTRASVFTCSAWNNGSSGPPPHSNPTASDQCDGSTLFTGTQNGQTLQYWH